MRTFLTGVVALRRGCSRANGGNHRRGLYRRSDPKLGLQVPIESLIRAQSTGAVPCPIEQRDQASRSMLIVRREFNGAPRRGHTIDNVACAFGIVRRQPCCSGRARAQRSSLIVEPMIELRSVWKKDAGEQVPTVE